MTDHPAIVLQALRTGPKSMRIMDIRKATGLGTPEIRDALAVLASKRIVLSYNYGMRYALRDRASFCPPAETHTGSSTLAGDTHQHPVCLCAGSLSAVAHVGASE